MYNTYMLLAKNRKALYDNELIDKYVAGVSLHGYEVKAVREGNVNFDGSYVQVIKNEAFVVNMYIGAYSRQSQSIGDTELRRTRKLLLNRLEIDRIYKELQQKGKTAVPLALVLDHNLVKLELAVVKGRKKAEKKHLEKERQLQKDLLKTTKEMGM
jgi:SsrA-binding protein